MNQIVHGCLSCRHIFRLEVYYLKDEIMLGNLCPNCGSEKVKALGPLPSVVEKDGVYYLADQKNMQGPFSSPLQAQASLWDWFTGEADATKKEFKNEKSQKDNFRVIDGGNFDEDRNGNTPQAR